MIKTRVNILHILFRFQLLLVSNDKLRELEKFVRKKWISSIDFFLSIFFSTSELKVELLYDSSQPQWHYFQSSSKCEIY